jgi:hypothetical protein
MCSRVPRIERDRLLEQRDSLVGFILGALAIVCPAPQHRIVGLGVSGLRKFKPRPFVMSEIHRKRGDDLPDDFVLQRENVPHRPIVALRPEVLATERVDELRIDANGVTLAPDTSLQHVAYAKILGHLLHLHGFALVGPTGVARND